MLCFREHQWQMVPGASRFHAYINTNDRKPAILGHASHCALRYLPVLRYLADSQQPLGRLRFFVRAMWLLRLSGIRYGKSMRPPTYQAGKYRYLTGLEGCY